MNYYFLEHILTMFTFYLQTAQKQRIPRSMQIPNIIDRLTILTSLTG